jgi:hypothetical protein
VIAGGGSDAGNNTDASVSDSGGGGGVLGCGTGTKLVDGKCVPNPPKAPIGSGCALGSECQSGTCAPAAENLPGGLCTVLGCSMENPCPLGSTCYQINKSLSICMAYCDRDTECRKDEGYHCQPLYSNAINICAPSCKVSKSCTAGTRCNEESGLCELAECEVGSSSSECSDTETCYRDSKGLSSKGGLCLNLCDPAKPEAKCVVDRNEVCQPMADDPSKGFCAPPVCSKTAECPAGADCKDAKCLAPPVCDGDSPCADDRTCVSGKCMPKCPSGDTHCSDIHPGLVCADVLSTPACLPLGSFPGSDCRPTATNKCDNSGGKAMVCQNDKCLADCTEGGDAACTALSSTLQCARGIFAKDLCLPKGSYPGSACGANNTCAQDLNGDSAVDMSCVSGTCVVTCSESGKWAGYGDALCSLVDSSLTCSTSAGSICVRACTDGDCASGYSCLDEGTIPAHENSCLPTGSFPGSPCRSGSSNQCDNNLGGNEAVDMQCVNDTCVVSCPSNADPLCQGVSSLLTCAESAGNICVLACNSGQCPTGYACLDPGDSNHQNACLPTGSFPSSPCRATVDDQCDDDVGGNEDADMVCVGGTCTVSCPSNNDALCAEVDSRLTCSESAGNVCVFACGNAGACPSGFSCLDAGGSGHQNACLPTGSFPSSPCRATVGDECDDDVGGVDGANMLCVAGSCVVSCPSNADALCGMVDSRLTCSESAGNLCVFKCSSGLCFPGYSCLSPNAENACLPTGSFPGSPCRSSGSPTCDLNVGGNPNLDLTCLGSTCAISCPGGSDLYCTGVSSALTCFSGGGTYNVCVPACGVGDTCPSNYTCNTGENACLPNP